MTLHDDGPPGGRTGAGPADARQELESWTRYRPTPVLDALLTKAVTIPSAAIHRHVDSVRRRNPEADPAGVIRILEKEYLTLVATAGGAVGAAAAAPAVGTGAAAALTTSDIATFFASSAAFSLAVADVHGVPIDDVQRRRALLLASVLGESGARDVEKAAAGSQLAWGKVLLTSMPQTTLKRVNKVLTHQFLKKQLAKQGTLALGRMIPFGVGAVVGFAGGRALGHGVVGQSRSAFGAPPDHFPRVIEQPPAALEEPAKRSVRVGRFRRRGSAVPHDDGGTADA
ncbi:hypothetical protein GCM10023216_05370 [Isoptericola chiayiensis]|uniref:EcsC family protein n=1 Tax=Isoptericola chiayiensis TaxID=579446 RepID=A0ABP8Y517_9MICO|nr:hypothetical protein [Isoptericola chiayiensis]